MFEKLKEILLRIRFAAVITLCPCGWSFGFKATRALEWDMYCPICGSRNYTTWQYLERVVYNGRVFYRSISEV